VLVAIPAAAFILPDLLGGHLLLTGDNLQQNYPLHVLVGSTLRHGQLPFWNQYIFSGTPLMADFNAGAFYPLMGLFVVLPDRAAWIATEVILFSAVAIGMYVFLRALKLSTVACFLGAATFAFSGTVLSQVNHVDMTEGFAAIPWMLLAVLHIVRDGRWRWSILLGIAYATVILGGAPEAMLDEALLVIAFAALSAGLDRGRWWRVLSRCGAGAALGLSLAAIQWLPGLEAISNSQRAASGASFASAGSYPIPFNILSLVPYLDGGYGHLGERPFFSQYNLPEVGIYLGILPLIALITLLHPRWPSRLPPRDRLTWYGVGLIGFLLAAGSYTPLEHVFNQLPLYGHQRLQSRNMITVSTAICVLFAGWIDRKGAVSERDVVGVRYDRVMAVVPFTVVAALAIWAAAAPASLVRVFAQVRASPSVVGTMREATLIALAFCAGAAAVVWLRPWLSSARWLSLVTVFVGIDIGIIALTSQLASWPPNDVVAGTTPVEQLMAAHLPPNGRMVDYDPQMYATYPNNPQGIPDLNIIPRLPSVSGYASIVNGNYESVTQTHTQGELNVGRLVAGTLDQLDLQEVVTVPEYFLVPLESMPATINGITQVSVGYAADPVLPRGYSANFDDQSYPFYPGRLGVVVLRRDALTPDRHPALHAASRHGCGGPLRVAPGQRDDTLVGPGAGAARSGPNQRPTSRGQRDRPDRVRAWFPARPASRRHRRGECVRARRVPVVGPRTGDLAPGGDGAELHRVHPNRTTDADRGGRHRKRATAARPRDLEHDQVRRGPGRRPGAVDRHAVRRLGHRVDRLGLGRWREGAEPRGRVGEPGPAGPHPGRTRRRDVPLPAAAPPGVERPQPRCARIAVVAGGRKAGTPAGRPAPGGRGRGRGRGSFSSRGALGRGGIHPRRLPTSPPPRIPPR
jgi:hypothetical protein